MDLYNVLTNEYNVRFSRFKKAKFRKLIKEEYEKLGYEVYEHKGLFANNLYIGNIKANKVLMAHYDTPPMTQLLMIFNNSFGTSLGQFLIGFLVVFLIFLPTIGIIVTNLFFIYFFLGIFFIGNKNNYTDNTSGVYTLLTYLKDYNIDPNEYLVVLTDNEEKGLFGSIKLKRYLKKNKLLSNKEIVVVDCIGNGEEYGVIAPKDQEIANKFYEMNKDNYKINRFSSKVITSDNAFFKNNAFLISKFSRSKFFNNVTIKNMHTSKDTELNVNNVAEVHNMIKNYFGN